MLDKLSSALKKTTDKIANAIFLDKNLVDQIVKDLQRALNFCNERIRVRYSRSKDNDEICKEVCKKNEDLMILAQGAEATITKKEKTRFD